MNLQNKTLSFQATKFVGAKAVAENLHPTSHGNKQTLERIGPKRMCCENEWVLSRLQKYYTYKTKTTSHHSYRTQLQNQSIKRVMIEQF